MHLNWSKVIVKWWWGWFLNDVWFLKDHETLKTRVIMVKIQLCITEINFSKALSDVTHFLGQTIFWHRANISSLSASWLSPEHTVKKKKHGLCRQSRLHQRQQKQTAQPAPRNKTNSDPANNQLEWFGWLVLCAYTWRGCGGEEREAWRGKLEL